MHVLSLLYLASFFFLGNWKRFSMCFLVWFPVIRPKSNCSIIFWLDKYESLPILTNLPLM